jgi:hypothetical protein
MVDTLGFIYGNVDAITAYLVVHEPGFVGIPTEFFELYAISFPFACFIRATEMRSCALPMVVPLGRQLFAELFRVSEFLCTATSRAILRQIQVRLLARTSLNNLNEALAAYSLTLSGRAEIRSREKGYTTQTSSIEGLLPLLNDGCDLKTYVVGGRTYDDTMSAIYQIISNSNPAFDFEEPASAPVVSDRFDHDDQSTENRDGDVIGTDTSLISGKDSGPSPRPCWPS